MQSQFQFHAQAVCMIAQTVKINNYFCFWVQQISNSDSGFSNFGFRIPDFEFLILDSGFRSYMYIVYNIYTNLELGLQVILSNASSEGKVAIT